MMQSIRGGACRITIKFPLIKEENKVEERQIGVT
jgi:hypothetical protein